MKLAEALILRSDCRKRLEQLRERMSRNARVQEGETPSEDALELLAEYDRVAADLVCLVKRINRTNMATRFDDTRSLSDVLAEREILLMRHKACRGLAVEATVALERYAHSEIPVRSAVSVSTLHKEADALARQYRELDSAIQRLNWTADLVE
jgi:hypothetical protein